MHVYDVYLLDNQEIKSGKEHVMPEQNVQFIYALPGRLTDYETLTFPTILPDAISNGRRAMSRKPDMGIVYKGETVIVPVANGSGSMTSRMEVSVGGMTVATRTDTLSHYSLDYQYLAVTCH